MALKDTFLGCELRQAANMSAADSHITFELTNHRRKEKQKQVEKIWHEKELGKKVREALEPHYYAAMDTWVNVFSL